MINWLDHLSSVLVAAVALLIVGGVFALRSANATQVTTLFSAQVAQRSFTDQLQIDLDNLGVGTPSGATPVVSKTATRFEFYTAVDTLGTSGRVAYEQLPAVDGVSRVRRTVDGSELGGTTDVTRFEVALLDGAGAAVTALADARQIRVDLRKRAPFQRPAEATSPGAVHAVTGERTAAVDEFETVGWTTEVRPFALRYPY